jgi:hypothetical protein
MDKLYAICTYILCTPNYTCVKSWSFPQYRSLCPLCSTNPFSTLILVRYKVWEIVIRIQARSDSKVTEQMIKLIDLVMLSLLLLLLLLLLRLPYNILHSLGDLLP